MRIFTEQKLKEYITEHPGSRVALQDWVQRVKRAEWRDFADIRRSFSGSVDCVGNQRYVFNIRGNNYRLIAVVRFTIKYVYIRFIGTHAEYERIKDITTI
ncbi:MAG: type II toxin-antitoxin system HigB family toxin [Paludibacteraceae bacterium]|nr:type II toxin-antitoxin system HigB family toxin [Paludibacteraceae bacterium]